MIEVGFHLLVLNADELELVPGYVGSGAVGVVADGESRAPVRGGLSAGADREFCRRAGRRLSARCIGTGTTYAR